MSTLVNGVPGEEIEELLSQAADSTRSRNNAQKTRGRPFPKGNPGRPKGARNKATLAAEALLDGEAEALTRRAIEMALAGDAGALRLCLERILPPRKARPVIIDLPEPRTGEDIAKGMASLVQAVARGELTPDEGQTISGILEAQRRAIETRDLEGRLWALEARNGAS